MFEARKWFPGTRCVKVSVVHPKNDRMLNAIRKSQGLLVVRYKGTDGGWKDRIIIVPKSHLKTRRNLWKVVWYMNNFHLDPAFSQWTGIWCGFPEFENILVSWSYYLISLNALSQMWQGLWLVKILGKLTMTTKDLCFVFWVKGILQLENLTCWVAAQGTAAF